MTNEEILSAIRTDGDPDNNLLMMLWNQNSGIVRKACRKFDGFIEEEDARQECFIAFTEAVTDYDPGCGYKFSTHMFRCMEWHLSRYIEECCQPVRIPSYQAQAIQQYRRFMRMFYQTHGRQPEDPEICAGLSMSRPQLEQLRRDMYAVNPKRLDKPLPGDTDGLTIADMVMDTGVDIENDAVDIVHARELKQAVRQAVDSLDKTQERQAIRLCYFNGMTYKEAGAVMGVSGARVRVCLANGIRKLRIRKEYKPLRGFIDMSPTYSMGLRGGIASFNHSWTSATEKTALRELERTAIREAGSQN